MVNIHGYPLDLQKRVERDIARLILQKSEQYKIDKLAKKYQVVNSVLCRVIPALIRKGLLEKVDETTVCIKGLPQANIESVFQYAQKAKLKPSTIVRDVSLIKADQFLSNKLKVKENGLIYQQIRTRLVDDHVLANQYNFIPFEICPGLENVDLSQRSFQVTLEEDYYTVIKRIEETYHFGPQTRDDAEILSLTENQEVIIVQRMSYSASNMPLVFADIHINPTQFHYVENLWPEAARLIQQK